MQQRKVPAGGLNGGRLGGDRLDGGQLDGGRLGDGRLGVSFGVIMKVSFGVI